MKLRHLTLIAASGLALATAAPAMADPILLDSSSIGTSNTINFNGFVNGDQTVDGLGAALTLTLTSITGSSYNFDYSMTNTTDTSLGIDSRVSSFAFNTDPNIAAATSTGTYNFTNTNSNYPNQIGTVDVCFQAGNTGSCAGNPGGLFGGATGGGSLSLNFGTAPASLTLDDFFVRYQSISGVDGITSASGRQVTGSSSGTDVPEPDMLLLFGAASLGAMFLRRRRKMPSQQRATVAYA